MASTWQSNSGVYKQNCAQLIVSDRIIATSLMTLRAYYKRGALSTFLLHGNVRGNAKQHYWRTSERFSAED